VGHLGYECELGHVCHMGDEYDFGHVGHLGHVMVLAMWVICIIESCVSSWLSVLSGIHRCW